MTLPSTMRAVTQTGPGGPEVLRVETLPVPKPGPGKVLIRVAWAGVNPHDIGQRKRGAPPPGQTPVFGLECSGEIVAVGDAAEPARIGQKVCALVPGGAYADYCLSPAGLAMPQPKALSEREAGALMENLFTAWFNMMELAGLKPGERVLAHGGTGSIGSTAIMIASLIGAEAYGTVGTEEKRRICLGLGAKAAINYRTEDVVKAVMAATGGAGVDVIVDPSGAGYGQRISIAREGRPHRLHLRRQGRAIVGADQRHHAEARPRHGLADAAARNAAQTEGRGRARRARVAGARHARSSR